ncbi:hypothetical protein [Methylocystis sp. ATCC 49242]|uniref:hypothetical protein n=1 Tax=Methylocystis sp. ATCC 49242 TaxID=622637 RepID=UPI0001F86870|nr:hypothetical protein [Methylocystis sp. ATCC 49242]
MTQTLEKSLPAARNKGGRRRVNKVPLMVCCDRALVDMLEQAAARRGLGRLELLRVIVAEKLAAEVLELERLRGREPESKTQAARVTELADAG